MLHREIHFIWCKGNKTMWYQKLACCTSYAVLYPLELKWLNCFGNGHSHQRGGIISTDDACLRQRAHSEIGRGAYSKIYLRFQCVDDLAWCLMVIDGLVTCFVWHRLLVYCEVSCCCALFAGKLPQKSPIKEVVKWCCADIAVAVEAIWRTARGWRHSMWWETRDCRTNGI